MHVVSGLVIGVCAWETRFLKGYNTYVKDVPADHEQFTEIIPNMNKSFSGGL